MRWVAGLFLLVSSAIIAHGGEESQERPIPLPPAQKPVNYAQPQREYTETNLSGWTVFLEKPSSIKTSNAIASAVVRLQRRLSEATNALPAASHELLRRLKIFVLEGPQSPSGGRDNGLEYFQRNASKANATIDLRWNSSIVIYSAKNYAEISDFWALKALVHEFAHAWHLEQWPEMKPDIRAAWLHAQSLGLYHDVLDEHGKTLKAGYATVNQLEYFAELSCMYFVGCNYYPTNRASLESYDPDGFALIKKMWRTEAAAH